jgi:hypothetical protein
MAVTTALIAVLRPEPCRIVSTFSVLGAAVHQVIRTIEIDNRLRILLAPYLAIAVGLFYGYLYLFPMDGYVPLPAPCWLRSHSTSGSQRAFSFTDRSSTA